VSSPYVPIDLRDCHGRLWRWNPWQQCYQYDDDLETRLWHRSTIETEAGPVAEVAP